MEMGNFRRGDIVWARVLFPHKWLPGIVLRRNELGVLISFFGYIKSRYFLESEISDFEQNFKSHFKSCKCSTTSSSLLNRTFKYLSQKVRLCLNYPIQAKRRRNPNPKLFQSQSLLGFVRSLAISPWIEDDGFVVAVNGFAQITAFRHYMLSSSTSRKIHSVASGELESLRPNNEDQHDINSSSRIEGQKTELLRHVLVKLKILALDPFYFDGECLNTLKGRVLSFRNLSYKSISNSLFKKCSPLERIEAQFSAPRLCDTGDGNTGRGETAFSLVPYMESPVNCLGLKRQLEQSTVSEPPLKLRKTLCFSVNGADAYLWRSRKECDAGVSGTSISGNGFIDPFCELCKIMPLSSGEAYAYLRRSMTGCGADLFAPFFAGSRLNLKAQNISSVVTQSSTCICSYSLMALVQNVLNFPIVKGYNSVRVCKDQKLVEMHDALDDNRTRMSYANMQQQQESETAVKDAVACISYANDVTEKKLRPSAVPSESKSAIGTHTGKVEAGDIRPGTRKYISRSHLTAAKLKMPFRNGENSASVKINREISTVVDFRRSFNENKELIQPGISDLQFKSKVGKQTEAQTTLAYSRTLLMKFPKNCNLPSKEELVKKFNRFGIVDSSSSKVHVYTGTAKVVFLHQLDAVAAYEYARRKKIVFRHAIVRCWLDPFEPKSRKPLTGELPGKSCLRKSKATEKEDNSCSPRKKVRFSV